MADYAAVLRKTIDALAENTPEARAKIYERARSTIEAKLAAVSAPPEQAARQKELLESAIGTVEADYSQPAAPEPDDDDLSGIFEEFEPAVHEPAPVADDSPVETGAIEAEEPDEAHPAEEATDHHLHEPEPAGEFSTHFDEESEAEPAEPALDEEGLPALDGPEITLANDADHQSQETEEATASRRGDLPPKQQKGRGRVLLPALLALIALGAAAYGGWHYRDDLASLASLGPSAEPGGQQDSQTSAERSEPVQAAGTDGGQPTSGQEAAAPESAGKFTQRLLADGGEVDEGPAGDGSTLGEGTSVAAATQADPVPAQAAAGEEGALPVGQSAIFYEERTNSAEGSAQRGNVVWSVAEESPGDNLPPEPVIRAEARVPGKDLQLKMTIRRNVDQSLPASHIIELIFLTPDNFGGGGINNVLRVAMKRTEQDTGSPLLGIPVKIADGFFLVALNDSRADLEANTTLMRRQSWIDIPLVYTSGRRALITLEKGVPGERIFNDAFQAWSQASNEESASGG